MNTGTIEIEELHIDASKRPKFAHFFCLACNPVIGPGSKALCGIIKKSQHNPNAYHLETCVVCVELKGRYCPTCKSRLI